MEKYETMKSPNSLTARISTCIFDFDGTLVDSRKDIVASLLHAFASCKVPARPVGVEIMMQMQLRETVVAMAPGISDEVRTLVMDRFQEHYDASGFPNTTLLPTVAGFLESLRGKSIPCYIVSNKRRIPMVAILEKFDLGRYFTALFNPDMYGTEKRMTKTALLAHALEKHTISKETTAYVGDMEIDVAAAKENGLIAIAVRNGYGKVEDFKVRPDFAVSVLGEIAGLIDEGGRHGKEQLPATIADAQGKSTSIEIAGR